MLTVFFELISLVAYATGAVLMRRISAHRSGLPTHPLEVLFVVAALVAIARGLPAHPGVTYGGGCIMAMLALGIFASAILHRGKAVAGGTREFEEILRKEKASSLWRRWLGFSRAIVDYEFRLLLVASYLVVVAWVAVPFRLLQRRQHSSNAASNWHARNDAGTLDAARRAF